MALVQPSIDFTQREMKTKYNFYSLCYRVTSCSFSQIALYYILEQMVGSRWVPSRVTCCICLSTRKPHLAFHYFDICLSCAEYTAPTWPYSTGLAITSRLRSCRTAFPGQPAPLSCPPSSHPLVVGA